jgi:exodeoxyribonuclease-5
LLSLGIPVIFVGDHNQLPPVIGKSSMLDKPDFILTKIMRQAENDPIVYLSQCILNDIPIEYGKYGNSEVISSIPIDRRVITDYDIILCAKNKTRDELNTEIRDNVLNIRSREPIIGDKMICRQNNWDECLGNIFLTNGLVGNITNIDYSTLYKNIIFIDFKPDFMDESFECIPLDYKYLRTPVNERNNYGMSDYNKFEFAYVITTHLSQGSEYNRVLFMDEWFHDEDLTRKLRYTAITRAKDMITMVKTAPKRYYVMWDTNRKVA